MMSVLFPINFMPRAKDHIVSFNKNWLTKVMKNWLIEQMSDTRQ